MNEQEVLESKPIGRPSTYTFEVGQEICDRLMQGELLTEICKHEGMPPRKTVYTWMDANPSFKDSYARARLGWCDFWAERVLAMAMDDTGDVFIENGKAVADHVKVARDRLRIDSAKWLVGKWGPRTYGERPVVEDNESKTIEITWQSTPSQPPAVYEPPKQLEYHKPRLPADLTEGDWSLLMDVLELIKRTVPTNDERPPAEVLGVLKEALLAHFSDK